MDPTEAYGASYWDPESLLSGETQVQTVFTVECAEVGRVMLPGSHDPQVAEGTDVEMPLWLASNLQVKGGVQISLPVYFGRRMQRRLQAGAECEDLRLRCPYYYGVGRWLNKLQAEERLPAMVQSTWRSRYHELLVQSLTGDSAHETGELTSRLTREEQQLFEAGRTSVLAFDRYKYTKSQLQRAASLKRKWSVQEQADKENQPQPRR